VAAALKGGVGTAFRLSNHGKAEQSGDASHARLESRRDAAAGGQSAGGADLERNGQNRQSGKMAAMEGIICTIVSRMTARRGESLSLGCGESEMKNCCSSDRSGDSSNSASRNIIRIFRKFAQFVCLRPEI
jgi:hypothetical protein